MKIIKDGKRNCGSFKFECDRCGCKYKANANDYERIASFDFDNGQYEIDKSGESSLILCRCPNCSKENLKDVYEVNESHMDDYDDVVLFVRVVAIICTFIMAVHSFCQSDIPISIASLVVLIINLVELKESF